MAVLQGERCHRLHRVRVLSLLHAGRWQRFGRQRQPRPLARVRLRELLLWRLLDWCLCLTGCCHGGCRRLLGAARCPPAACLPPQLLLGWSGRHGCGRLLRLLHRRRRHGRQRVRLRLRLRLGLGLRLACRPCQLAALLIRQRLPLLRWRRLLALLAVRSHHGMPALAPLLVARQAVPAAPKPCVKHLQAMEASALRRSGEVRQDKTVGEGNQNWGALRPPVGTPGARAAYCVQVGFGFGRLHAVKRRRQPHWPDTTRHASAAQPAPWLALLLASLACWHQRHVLPSMHSWSCVL